MLKKLRWQLVLAFGLLILLVVVLSGAFSIWMTFRRFQLLVTEENRIQAQEIAPLLEASYAHWGDWHGLEELLASGSNTPPALFEEIPISEKVDWLEVSAEVLGMEKETLVARLQEGNSIADLARAQGLDAEAVIQAIIRAELEAMPNLTEEERSRTRRWLEKNLSPFVEDRYLATGPVWPDWYALVAGELGLSEETLLRRLEEEQASIAEIAAGVGVSTESLIEVIRQAERRTMESEGYSQAEIEEAMQGFEAIAEDFLTAPWLSAVPVEPSLTGEDTTWLLSNFLLTTNRLLVADREGKVVLDSSGEMQGEMLSASMLYRGIPLFNPDSGDFIGTVIVAAGPTYYTAHQWAFLRGVSLSLIASGLLAGVVALLVGVVLARRITAPVTALTEASRHLASGDHSVRLPVHSDDELGQMSAAFNRMADELSRQRELRNRLVHAVAHELGTPLSVIQLEVEAMEDGMQSPQAAAQAVRREIALLRGLVDDLALLAETDAGTLQIAPKPMDALRLVQEARERWLPQAEAGGLRLEIVPPAGPLPPVLADPMRIGQVLGNLLANAMRHTPPGGRITIRLLPGQEEVSILVEDTGEGVADEDLPHIFEAFYRADRSRSRRTGGHGLGLSIVRQVVEAHGGRVWVESRLGEGSLFGFTLPLAGEPTPAPRRAPSSA